MVNYRTDVLVSEKGMTVKQLTSDIGDIVCNAGQVGTQLTCVGSTCDSGIQLHCGTPLKGQVKAETSMLDWFPQIIGGTEASYCTGKDVLVGIYCGSARCARKMLTCAPLVNTDVCAPGCKMFGLECGDDGCGGSCGECSLQEGATSPVCRGDVGRCMYTLSSNWATSDYDMSRTDLVASGMGCKNKYCEKVQLIFLSISVDASWREKSHWISDNVGARFPWNNNVSGDTVADCPTGTALAYLECRGKYCDNIRLTCAKPLQWIVDMTTDPTITEYFSDAEPGRMDCDDGKVITGVECKGVKKFCLVDCGDYCTYKRLRCRKIMPETAGKASIGIISTLQLLPATVTTAVPAPSPWWTKLTPKKTTGVSAAPRRPQLSLVTTTFIPCGLMAIFALTMHT